MSGFYNQIQPGQNSSMTSDGSVSILIDPNRKSEAESLKSNTSMQSHHSFVNSHQNTGQAMQVGNICQPSGPTY